MKIKPFLPSVLLLTTINWLACKSTNHPQVQNPKPLMGIQTDSLKMVIDSIRANRSK